jgi:hypothetical protein
MVHGFHTLLQTTRSLPFSVSHGVRLLYVDVNSTHPDYQLDTRATLSACVRKLECLRADSGDSRVLLTRVIRIGLKVDFSVIQTQPVSLMLRRTTQTIAV